MVLDLSCNSLTGVIPREIGSLAGLRSLNFSWNSLSGAIPEKIGELKQLESLDLSNNELSGQIPSSMTGLTSLSHINLSYNNLSGKIPTGNQFQTFDASDYIGNIGLCGYLYRKWFKSTYTCRSWRWIGGYIPLPWFGCWICPWPLGSLLCDVVQKKMENCLFHIYGRPAGQDLCGSGI